MKYDLELRQTYVPSHVTLFMVKDVTTIKSQEEPQNFDPKPVVVIESAKPVSINPNISVR